MTPNETACAEAAMAPRTIEQTKRKVFFLMHARKARALPRATLIVLLTFVITRRAGESRVWWTWAEARSCL